MLFEDDVINTMLDESFGRTRCVTRVSYLCNEVFFSLSFMCMSAPFPHRIFTISRSPLIDAIWRGVIKLLLWALTLAPYFKHSSTDFTFLLSAAKCKAQSWSTSGSLRNSLTSRSCDEAKKDKNAYNKVTVILVDPCVCIVVWDTLWFKGDGKRDKLRPHGSSAFPILEGKCLWEIV